jgi:hypothetical protein
MRCRYRLTPFNFDGKKWVARPRPTWFLAAPEHDEVDNNGDDHEHDSWHAAC